MEGGYEFTTLNEQQVSMDGWYSLMRMSSKFQRMEGTYYCEWAEVSTDGGYDSLLWMNEQQVSRYEFTTGDEQASTR